jgi:DNA-binding transcriptional LysR family regulator
MDGSAVPAVVRGAIDAMDTWTITTASGMSRVAVDPVLSLSSMIMLRDAARVGAGIARLPVSLVGRDIANGRLRHWGDVAGSEITLWALYPSRRLLSARVSAFLDLLKEAFPKGLPDELAAFMDR